MVALRVIAVSKRRPKIKLSDSSRGFKLGYSRDVRPDTANSTDRKASAFSAQDEWKPIDDLTVNFACASMTASNTPARPSAEPRVQAVWSLPDGVTLHVGMPAIPTRAAGG